MNYKKTKDFVDVDLSELSDFLQQNLKFSSNFENDFKEKSISEFNDLKNILFSFENGVNIKDSILKLESICCFGDTRPSPNELLYNTNLFAFLWSYIFSDIDEEYKSKCFQIIIYLSCAPMHDHSCFFIPEFIDNLIHLVETKFYIEVLALIYNICVDDNFGESQAISMINEKANLIYYLAKVINETSSLHIKSVSFQILVNIAKILSEIENNENLEKFEIMMPIIISSLKPNYSQRYAIELFSYLSYNKKICEKSLELDTINSLKESLQSKDESFSTIACDVYISINSLIKNCGIASEFVEYNFIKNTMNYITLIDPEDTRTLFLFLYILCDDYWKFLNDCNTPEFLINLIHLSPYKIRQKAIVVLSHLLVHFITQPIKVEWLPISINIIIEYIHALSPKKAEHVLEEIVYMCNTESQYFLSVLDNSIIFQSLEEINDMDGVNDNIIQYTDYLNSFIRSHFKDDL